MPSLLKAPVTPILSATVCQTVKDTAQPPPSRAFPSLCKPGRYSVVSRHNQRRVRVRSLPVDQSEIFQSEEATPSGSTRGPDTEQGHGDGFHKEAMEPVNGAEAQKTKDYEALQALNSYFDILRPKTEDEKEKERRAAAKVETTSSDQPATTSSAQDETVDQKELKKDVVEAWKKAFDIKVEVKNDTPASQEDWEQLLLPLPPDPWQELISRAGPASSTNLLAALNIGVFLFELASPQVIPGELTTSLPSIFGAKVNELILGGQYWRLITPSFLHSGFFHLVLGTWGLLSVGPVLEMAFGSAGLVALYLITGAFGNLMSFANTAAPTIGGTGPVYGLVGAMIVYLLKNREVIGKEQADGILRRVIFLSALNIALGNPPPIDDWTHIGAVFGGLFFAAVAAPEIVRKEREKKPQEQTKTEERDLFGNKIIIIQNFRQPDADFLLENKPVSLPRLGLAMALSIGLFVALLEVGLTGGVNVLSLLDTDFASRTL